VFAIAKLHVFSYQKGQRGQVKGPLNKPLNFSLLWQWHISRYCWPFVYSLTNYFKKIIMPRPVPTGAPSRHRGVKYNSRHALASRRVLATALSVTALICLVTLTSFDLWIGSRLTRVMGFHPVDFGLLEPFRSRVRSRNARNRQTDRQTDTTHHFIMPRPDEGRGTINKYPLQFSNSFLMLINSKRSNRYRRTACSAWLNKPNGCSGRRTVYSLWKS